jgi:hypothetical protein
METQDVPEKARFLSPIRFRYGFHILTFPEIEVMGSNLAKCLASNIRDNVKEPRVGTQSEKPVFRSQSAFDSGFISLTPALLQVERPSLYDTRKYRCFLSSPTPEDNHPTPPHLPDFID